MYREKIEELIQWRKKTNRKPLILMGARQVGKTWLLKEFGNTCFRNVCYINFENPGMLADIFEGSIEPSRIIEFLGAYAGEKILPEDTLIIFDEVQEVPRALTSLKYFAENAPEYVICCAGSLLGVTLHDGTSFPVGKVDFAFMEPMSFMEFLMACGESPLIKWSKANIEKPLPEAFREKYIDYLKKYYVIGGMPAVVNQWINTKDFREVEEQQSQLLTSYSNDFSKHAPSVMVPKIHHVWDSIPSQLSKENKKFVYGVAKEGARAREYEDAIMWLKDSGVVRRVNRIAGGRIPLKGYEDLKAFKLYHLDIGLLRYMCEIPASIIVGEHQIFTEYMGALTEQFVLQELQNSGIAKSIYYWGEGSTAEVDFIFSEDNMVIPLEAKAGLAVRAKSLRVFRDKYHPKIAIRTSLKNLKFDNGLLNLPLFQLWNIKGFLDMYR